MTRGIVILCVVFALGAATDANAQLITKPACRSKTCVASSQLLNLKHAKLVCQDRKAEAKRWNCAAVRWLKREYKQTMATLHPRVSVSLHLKGWECITNGAYPGAPHEGNGVNGSDSGPLGMTDPWAGYSGDWVHMNPISVYRIAEKIARQHGFSYSWMAGQWPNTFPPCASRFTR